MQATEVLDASKADFVTEIWGFNTIPNLPLVPEHVLGDYNKLGIFGPTGSVRVSVMSIPPEIDGQPSELGDLIGKVDFGTGGGMTPGPGGPGMHRTDSIDFLIVLKGEIDIAYPGEDGQVKSVTVKEGDFIVQNGAYHEWRNRSKDLCVILVVVFGADRGSDSSSVGSLRELIIP